MDYRDAVRFHEKTEAYGSVLGLESIRALSAELGDVWRSLSIVHVAGTNGKGSVCCFLASVLKEAGYRVGQFNSPAVFGVRDAFQIDGELISEEDYALCMQDVAKACKDLTKQGLRHPTAFEVDTALAFLWFYRKKCDLVLLEVGMGGSTDATNVIERPLCSVFTPISLDHMDYLGNSLCEIAETKAGIIKYGCPVISDVRQSDAVSQVLKEFAHKNHAAFCESERMEQLRAEDGRLVCRHPVYGELRLAMAGSYQAGNAALAIAVLERLKAEGFSVTKEQMFDGLNRAVWPGRFECILKKPLFYIDGAHNTDAAKQLKESLLLYTEGETRIGIMGVMADKAYGEMLDMLLPLFERIYTVTPQIKRALSAEVLAEEIWRRGGAALAQESVAAACRKALSDSEGAVIVAFGSLYFLDEVKREVCK